MEEKEIGTVAHYFTKIGVGIVQLSDPLKVGDTLRFVGHTSNFTQVIDSMQIEHANVTEAKAGDMVGIKVKEHVRQHDKVYKVIS